MCSLCEPAGWKVSELATVCANLLRQERAWCDHGLRPVTMEHSKQEEGCQLNYVQLPAADNLPKSAWNSKDIYYPM
jgi:hypothetical protein